MKTGQASRLRRPSPRKLALKFAGRTKAIWADQRGVAAIEFGFFAIFLSLALVNVTDVSIYIYQRMQAENATQVAAQAAWKACDLSQLPATTKLLWTSDRCPECAWEHLAWNARFLDIRLAVRGLLLRQFSKRAAIRQ